MAGRYEIRRILGEGGFGTVYRALDHVTGQEVAVKLLRRRPMESHWLRREVVALRGLRLAGVVRLLDEGEDSTRGEPFLVMDLVEGQRFPGTPVPAPWNEVEHVAAGLLEIVGRVHAAGVLHLDLNPRNVMVTRGGEVVLLDLGLACGPALGGAAPAQSRAGTRLYAAPEQRGTGQVSKQSDLYAVGVMLWEALDGRLPPEDGLPPGDHIGDAPAPVVSMIHALVAEDPAQRPASAWAALDQLLADLGRRKPDWTPALPDGAGPLAVDALRACCRGPERLFHVPTDAAVLLHQRTGGQRDRVVSELRRWIRMGLAVPDEGRLRVDRAAIDQLEAAAALGGTLAGEMDGSAHAAAPEPSRSRGDAAIVSLIAAGRYGEVPATARVIALEYLEEGRFDQVRSVLEQALMLIRRGQASPDDGPALLVLWAQMAFEERSPEALGLALYQVERAVGRTAAVDALELLLRSALYAEQGESPRARDLLAELPPFAEPSLELWRHWVCMRLAIRQSNEEAARALAAMDAWAREHGTEDAMARVLDWRARLLYREGSFEESARLQERAAHRARWRTVRLSSMLNSAAAWIEAGDYAMAEELALEVLEDAVAHRYVLYEARAEWLLRTVMYRARWGLRPAAHGAERVPVPDVTLVDAVERLKVPYLAGMVCLNEAAVAWRHGDPALAHDLARRAHSQFSPDGYRDGRVLAHTLQLACRAVSGAAAAGSLREELEALAHDVAGEPIPDVDWQVLGVLARLPGGAHWQAEAVRRAGEVHSPDLCRELLAPREVLARGRETPI